jgi:hypothetical protein
MPTEFRAKGLEMAAEKISRKSCLLLDAHPLAMALGSSGPQVCTFPLANDCE